MRHVLQTCVGLWPDLAQFQQISFSDIFGVFYKEKKFKLSLSILLEAIPVMALSTFTLITNSFYYKLTLNSFSFRLFPCSFSPDINRLRFRRIKIYLIPFPWQPLLEIHNKSQAYVRTVIFGPWKASLMCFVFVGTELGSLFPRQRGTVATPAGSNAHR